MSYQPPDGTQPPPSVPYPTNPAYQPGAASVPPPQPPLAPEAYPPTSQFPPQGPPPPGYGYQPGPPPPPPRKSNLPLIAVIVAVTLLLCGGVATAGVLIARQATEKAKEAVEPIVNPTLPALPTLPAIPSNPVDIPGIPGSGAEIKVTYEVRGDGPVDIIYIEKLGDGPKTLSEPKLPWKFSTTMQGAALVSVTAVRGSNDEGDISCRALVDGKEVAQSSRSGAFASVSCIKAVLG